MRKTMLYSLVEDGTGETLYVGITFTPKHRLAAHRKRPPEPLALAGRTRFSMSVLACFRERTDAAAEELRLIDRLRPPGNVAGTPELRQVIADKTREAYRVRMYPPGPPAPTGG